MAKYKIKSIKINAHCYVVTSLCLFFFVVFLQNFIDEPKLKFCLLVFLIQFSQISCAFLLIIFLTFYLINMKVRLIRSKRARNHYTVTQRCSGEVELNAGWQFNSKPLGNWKDLIFFNTLKALISFHEFKNQKLTDPDLKEWYFDAHLIEFTFFNTSVSLFWPSLSIF